MEYSGYFETFSMLIQPLDQTLRPTLIAQNFVTPMKMIIFYRNNVKLKLFLT